jgi:hypothetical protein
MNILASGLPPVKLPIYGGAPYSPGKDANGIGTISKLLPHKLKKGPIE